MAKKRDSGGVRRERFLLVLDLEFDEPRPDSIADARARMAEVLKAHTAQSALAGGMNAKATLWHPTWDELVKKILPCPHCGPACDVQ